MNIPNNIAPEEELGRSVFSSREAKRARRSRVSHYAFLEKEGQTDISVDRLSIAPAKEAVAIADNVGAARTHSATFYGWAVPYC